MSGDVPCIVASGTLSPAFMVRIVMVLELFSGEASQLSSKAQIGSPVLTGNGAISPTNYEYTMGSLVLFLRKR